VSSGSNRWAATGLTVFLLAATGVGCGSQEPDLINGKTLFVQKCASCHRLARANASGVKGPDLDAAFGPARGDGLGEQTVAGVVEMQIGNVRRSSTMPADLVGGQDAADVAAYVARVAGQPGEDTGALATAGAPEVSNKPIVAESGTLEIPADPTGALAFASTKAEAPAGSIEVMMPNPSSVEHNIAIADEGGEVIEEGPVVGKGESSDLTADLEAGKYQFVCTVPGHAEGGMKGELTVK
jgi:mono/diheme cytochrome c family protein